MDDYRDILSSLMWQKQPYCSKKLLKIANNSGSENVIPYVFSLYTGHLSSVTQFTNQF